MTTQRIRSIDVVRGIVMVLMALDHVRVVSGIPAGGPTPAVFLRDGGIGWLAGNHPTMIGPAPEGYRWSLPLLCAITALCVALLYLPCRWFAAHRARRPDSRLRYL